MKIFYFTFMLFVFIGCATTDIVKTENVDSEVKTSKTRIITYYADGSDIKKKDETKTNIIKIEKIEKIEKTEETPREDRLTLCLSLFAVCGCLFFAYKIIKKIKG